MMINLKVLSTAAVMALVLPIAMSSMSFAQGMGGNARGGHSAPGGGGGAGWLEAVVVVVALVSSGVAVAPQWVVAAECA